MLFYFLEQKTDLEQLYETDERLLNKKFRSKKAIYCDSRHRTYEARWEAACELRNKAMHLPDRERESAWNGLMTNFVFQGVTYQASEWVYHVRYEDLSRLTRTVKVSSLEINYLGKRWSTSLGTLTGSISNMSSFRGSDELFTNAVSIRGRFSDGNDYQPKPDFWFGLGLYDDRQLSLLEGLELKDKGIEYFTQEKLEAIRPIHNENLIYQPVGSRKYAAFPWMVVELKAEFRSERECIRQEKECIRQAANASHASLVLCKRLAKPAAIDASPIVAFTSVGPEVKVFIAYKSKEDGEDEVYVCPPLNYGIIMP